MELTSFASASPSSSSAHRNSQTSRNSSQRETFPLVFNDSAYRELTSRRPVELPGDDSNSAQEGEEVVLSVFRKNGKIGAAYYNCGTCELFLVSDVEDVSPEFQVLKSLLIEIEPTTIITSAKIDQDFQQALKKLTKLHGSPETESSRADTSERSSPAGNPNARCKLKLLPSTYFELESCRRRVYSIELPGQPANLSEQDRYLYLSSVVPLSSCQMVQAAGALLRLLEQWTSGKDLERALEPRQYPILALIPRPASKLFWIDPEAYTGLNIFSQDSHPSSVKRGTANAAKEGLSLFGIMQRCKSPVGRWALRLMFMMPTYDVEVLEERLTVVDFCTRSTNKELAHSLLVHTAALRNVSRVFVKVDALQASVTEWQTLYTTAYHLVAIGQICRRLPSHIKLFNALADTWESGTLQIIVQHIHTMIDFEESKTKGRIAILPGVSAELDRTKQQLAGVNSLLNEVAIQELEDVPPFVTSCVVTFFPELGFLLGVPISDQLITLQYQIPGLKFMFKINDTLHYKSPRCTELDLTLGKSFCEIIQMETRFVIQLSQVVMLTADDIRKALALAGQLDALLSLATVAVEQNLVRPVFSQTEDGIRIEGGWHILHRLCVDNFVPNDTQLGGPDQPRIMVLSGPNSSGKSVYLKQTALIVFLAHIGSFVPAKKAILSPMKGLFSRIPSQGSSSARLSSFATDLNQMTRALHFADGQSLIVADEFGSGTCYLDGFSFLATFLSAWANQAHRSPFVLVATHYHALFKHAPSTPLLTFKKMKLLYTKDEVINLYQIIDGTCETSEALKIAHSVGMPPSIIERAGQTLEHLCTGTSLSRETHPRTEAFMITCGTIVEECFQTDFETCEVDKFLNNSVQARWMELEQTFQNLTPSRAESSAGEASSPSVQYQCKQHTPREPVNLCTPQSSTPRRGILRRTPRSDPTVSGTSSTKDSLTDDTVPSSF